jgi:uncharacterized membrane protein YkoI
MNKTLLICVIAAAVIAVAAGVALMGGDLLTSTGSASEPDITKEEAKAIAEEYTDGEAKSVSFEDDEEGPMYEVHITNATGDWEVEVDGKTGEVTEVERDDHGEEDDDDDKAWWEWNPF